MTKSIQQFQSSVLTWFDQYGRKHLPWQQNKTPYRVWVSEIMLQQTQVRTVVPYYERFMQQFPTLETLANAPEDAVLHLWAGLGYYSRARMLHRTAKIILSDYQGKFPNTLAALKDLPGIGPSTAGAILAIAFHQTATILDGNVKRVLARIHGLTAPINEKATENKLWELAVSYTPSERIADYTQAMMDIGATLCTRGKPDCPRCPLVKMCLAHQQNMTELIPLKKAPRKLPTRAATFLILKKGKHILLRKRPPMGIWGGLWSLPEIATCADKKMISVFCQQHFQVPVIDYQALPSLRHTFSHYHLDMFPVVIEIKKLPSKIMEAGLQIWYDPDKPEKVGLPKPVLSIIKALT